MIEIIIYFKMIFLLVAFLIIIYKNFNNKISITIITLFIKMNYNNLMKNKNTEHK